MGSSPLPCNEDYRGAAPFSEPETQAIKAYVEKNKERIKVVINCHA
jgi:carboxypeptidase T